MNAKLPGKLLGLGLLIGFEGGAANRYPDTFAILERQST
jgi:hypothetical protein